MRNDKPNVGGIASVLQFIGGMELVVAFFGGALANLSLGAEVVLMVAAFVSACLLWAAAAVVQELRKIEFNTRAPALEVGADAASPVDEDTAEARWRARNNVT